MIVTSKKTISFPGFKWGINKGEKRELPEDKKVQEIILAHPAISEAKEGQAEAPKEKTTSKVEGAEKKDNKLNN